MYSEMSPQPYPLPTIRNRVWMVFWIDLRYRFGNFYLTYLNQPPLLRLDLLQELAGRLVLGVLRHQLPLHGQSEDEFPQFS